MYNIWRKLSGTNNLTEKKMIEMILPTKLLKVLKQDEALRDKESKKSSSVALFIK